MRVDISWEKLRTAVFMRAAIVAGLFLSVLRLDAGQPMPAWHLAALPERAVLRSERIDSGFCVAEVTVGQDSDVAVLDRNGGALPYRVVYADDRSTQLLVQWSGSADSFFVYYGPGMEETAGDPTPHLCDPSPVRASLYKLKGKGLPDTWDRMLYLHAGAGKPTKCVLLSDISHSVSLPRRDGQTTDKVRGSLAVLRTFLLCPHDGVYHFAIQWRYPVFLLVDGDRAGVFPDGDMGEEWQRGPALFLREGLHELQVFACDAWRLALRVGWEVPGSDRVAGIPREALIAADKARTLRVERSNKILHPGFTHRVLRAYSFRGLPQVFVPVSLRSVSSDWMTRDVKCHWRFAGGAVAHGASVTHVFSGAQKHRAVLQLRDSLGFTARHEARVDCRMAQPREYAVDFRPVLCPPVSYAPDVVEPCLRVSGTLPSDAELEVVWDTSFRPGFTRSERRSVSLATNPAFVPFTRSPAGALSEIRWRVLHQGHQLGGGLIRYLSPPFDAVPVRVDGTHMYSRDGVQLVLVPRRSGGGITQLRIPTRKAFGNVLCIDDFLAAPGLPGVERAKAFHRTLARIVDGPDKPHVTYHPVNGRRKFPDAYGMLSALVDASSAVEDDTDVVIISIGLHSLLEERGPDRFERYLAALTDIIQTAMNKLVVLVTLPPYPPDPARVRPFAAAVKRVADARRIPVADLFTACLGAEPGAAFFLDGSALTLSGDGQELAAEVIAGAMLSE